MKTKENWRAVLGAVEADELEDDEVIDLSASPYRGTIQLTPAAWVKRGLPQFGPPRPSGRYYARIDRHGVHYCSCARPDEMEALAS